MKNVRPLKFFGLFLVFALALSFNIYYLSAQAKPQAKPPAQKPCNNNGICETGEAAASSKEQWCPDCYPKAYLPLVLLPTQSQIVSTGSTGFVFSNDKVFQFIGEDNDRDGIGKFKDAWASNPHGSTSRVLRAISIGDADNDGYTEIIATLLFESAKGRKISQSQKIYLYESGSTGDPDWISPDIGYNWSGIRDSIIADADRDRLNEIILVKDTRVEIYRLADRNFQKLWSSPDYNYSIWSVDVGDADNDRAPEVVLAMFGIGSAIVYEYLEENMWGSPVATASIGPYNIDYAKVRDVDGDSLMEIVAGGTSNKLNIWKYDNGVYQNIFLSRDLGGFTQGIDVGNIDGDLTNGIEIIVGTSSPGNSIYVYRYGNGTFNVEYFMPLGSGAGMLATGDIDHDGLDEIAMAFEGLTIIEFANKALLKTFNCVYGGGLEIF